LEMLSLQRTVIKRTKHDNPKHLFHPSTPCARAGAVNPAPSLNAAHGCRDDKRDDKRSQAKV